MTMVLSGDGTVTGLVAGGLPDGTVQASDILDGAVTPAKLSGAQTGAAPVFGARAFCTWNGATTGTYAPTLPSGNISSIVRNGAGDYTFNFSTPLVDGEYAVVWGGNGAPTMGIAQSMYPAMGVLSQTSSAVRVQFYSYAGSSNAPTGLDVTRGHIAIFR